MIFLAALALVPKSSWTQKLPTGDVVSLVAVSNFAQRRSWSGDGSRQSKWMVPDEVRSVDQTSKAKDKKTRAAVTFVVQLHPHDASAQPSVVFKSASTVFPGSFTLHDSHDKKLWWVGAVADGRKLSSSVDLMVGIGGGTWKSASVYNLESGETKGPKFFGSIMRVTLSGRNVIEMQGTIPASVAGKMACRIKLFDVAGHALMPEGFGPVKQGGDPRYFFIDNGNRIVRSILYTEPCKWVMFKGVHTK